MTHEGKASTPHAETSNALPPLQTPIPPHAAATACPRSPPRAARESAFPFFVPSRAQQLAQTTNPRHARASGLPENPLISRCRCCHALWRLVLALQEAASRDTGRHGPQHLQAAPGKPKPKPQDIWGTRLDVFRPEPRRGRVRTPLPRQW